MFGTGKFRAVKSIGVAALTALAALVAVPAPTSASVVPSNVPLDDLTVRINYRGSPPYVDSIAVKVGSAFDLEAVPSTDRPLQTAWEVVIDPGVGRVSNNLSAPKIRGRCVAEGLISLTVTVTDEAGKTAFDSLIVYCQNVPTPEISPRPFSGRQRELVAVGTTIEFTSVNYVSAIYDSEWRTTGVAGIAGYGETFERTFDKLGNVGVELTDVNEVGRAKTWVGYTVIGPPTVAVSPSPAKPDQDLRVAVGSTVTFDGSGSRSPGGGSLNYEWQTTGVSGVAGDQVTLTRKFDTVGSYAVKLTVVNELGQSVDQRVGISVFEPKSPIASVTPAPPNPKERMKVTVGSRITFNGAASNDPDGGSLTYSWRTTGVRNVVSSGPTYTREFNAVGKYGVELIVIDDEGQRSKRWVGLDVVPG